MDEDVEVVLAVLRAVEERDRAALLALLHEDVEFHDAGSLPYGGVTRGKAEARVAARPEKWWSNTGIAPRARPASASTSRYWPFTRSATASSRGRRCSTTTPSR